MNIVIVGAGFGGLFCARGLTGEGVRITLIDRQNHHLFQPLLYQVATGFLGLDDIALPIRNLFRNKRDIEIVMAEATGVDTSRQCVITRDQEYTYDILVLAPGSQYHFFGHDAWSNYVETLKTLSDAATLRQRILTAFERAECESNPTKRKELLRFVIIGGGPTGVEMAGAIADTVNYALPREFRHIRKQDAEIILIEASLHLLGVMAEPLSRYAKAVLEKKRGYYKMRCLRRRYSGRLSYYLPAKGV